MSQLLVLAAVVAVAVLMLSEEARAAVRRRLPRLLLYGGLAALVLLVVTGRLHWIAAAVGGAGALLARLRPLLGLWPMLQWLRGRQAQAESGGTWVRFFRDDTAGAMDGEVLQGPLAGRRLSQLTREQLEELAASCQAEDPEAAALLQAYIGRRKEGTGTAGGGSMSPEEAYSVLGLDPGADPQAIVDAHRRLMQRLHPDRGGSGELAARVNRAKAVLLDRGRRAG